MGKKSRSKRASKPESYKLRTASISNNQPAVTIQPTYINPSSLRGGGKPANLAEVQTDYIRTDIVRILLLLLTVGLMLSVTWLTSQKTSYILNGGRALSSFLKL